MAFSVSNIHLYILKAKVAAVKMNDSQAQYNVKLDHQDLQEYSKSELIKIVFVYGVPVSLVLVLLLSTALLLKLINNQGVEISYQFINTDKGRALKAIPGAQAG